MLKIVESITNKTNLKIMYRPHLVFGELNQILVSNQYSIVDIGAIVELGSGKKNWLDSRYIEVRNYATGENQRFNSEQEAADFVINNHNP